MKKRTSFYSMPMAMAVVILLIATPAAEARTVTQLMPTLTVSEDYTDNYLKADTSTKEEFITSYRLGFSLGFLNPRSKIYLSYSPEYKDYKNFNNRDRFQHNTSLTGQFNPTKFTDISAGLSYSANTDELAGESYDNTADIRGRTQLTKNTYMTYSESYSRSFDQQQRTGDYLEHDVNITSFGLSNQYGDKSSRGFNVSYSFDSYDQQNADEYTKISPSGFYSYWFNPLNGLDFYAGYENTDFDNSSDDIDSYKGHVRYIRKFSRHFDGYVKYRHSFSDRDSGEHTIYHPSLGFDWQVTEDSGISLGIGLLFHEWDSSTNDDSTDPFVDINAYKIINFSRRGSLLQ